MGTPIYQAGLDVGDAILSIDSQAVHSATDIATILSASAPGKTVSVEYSNRGVHGTVQVTLGEAGQYAFDADSTDRQAWLGAQ
jgi:S1-C subfamily serine protease